jgi:hypothetical protein
MDGGGGCGKREALEDQVFDSRPEFRIAFALHVAGGEKAVGPGSFGAFDRLLAVVGQVVAQDFSFGGVGGGDARASMDDSVGLIKIDGCRDIAGNDGVVLPDFGYAIDLDGEQNRDAGTLQIAGEQHGGGGSPTLTEKDDVGAGLFLGGKSSVAVGVEQLQNRVIGAPAAAVLEYAHISVAGKCSADSLGNQHRTMVLVIMADESADESDDNVGGGRRSDRDGIDRMGGHRHRDKKASDDRIADCRKRKHGTAYAIR